ncbi:site-specific integrase [Sphingomonadaceae bacterium G21617-S1]|uniref:site-specific integrase n=1 Tax=Sphingomonas sp. NBWT7 TaxID=2596913 RepID=UPI001627974C|nr:site-specific integrase [Sphingomonas sp. NBWT7]MCZ4343934.1 site-specific integrase [Sphingomonadaceae bacterium G21617-S1]QNE33627.1 site-specific integrase [Sphingomonas sp. NBWT7]
MRVALPLKQLGLVAVGARYDVAPLEQPQIERRRIWHDSAYWIPLLLVYTGCRREEVAKAMVSDIELIDGIWVLRVRRTEAGRVKTESSVRDVPLADEALRLGFLSYVDHLRSAGAAALFPELGAQPGKFGDIFYKKWWRGFERAGLVPEGKDMHSIRHFVATELAVAGVSEERRADLLGHTVTSSETARTYTKRTPLVILQQIVNMIPVVTSAIMPLR